MSEYYGFTINGYHTYDDFGLRPIAYEQNSAPPKRVKIDDVPGKDDSIDLTEIVGGVYFDSYTQKYLFETLIKPLDFENFRTDIIGKLHGKFATMIMDNDTDYYRSGFLEIKATHDGFIKCTVTFTFDFESHKYKKELTTETIISVTSTTVTVTNSHKNVIPTFTSSNGNMAVEVNGGAMYGLLEGEYSNYEIYLVEGENTIKVTGNGTVIVSYREGVL